MTFEKLVFTDIFNIFLRLSNFKTNLEGDFSLCSDWLCAAGVTTAQRGEGAPEALPRQGGASHAKAKLQLAFLNYNMAWLTFFLRMTRQLSSKTRSGRLTLCWCSKKTRRMLGSSCRRNWRAPTSGWPPPPRHSSE